MLFAVFQLQFLFLRDQKNENAGIIAFQNEINFYYIGKTFKKNRAVIHLIKAKNVQNTHYNSNTDNCAESEGGFLGTIPGRYASLKCKDSENHAYFPRTEYTDNDPVFNDLTIK